jgi:hypothetical protein
MRLLPLLFSFLCVSILLSSCEFQCSVGDTKKTKAKEGDQKPVVKDGATLYNGIQLSSGNVKVNKAYLLFKDNNERVPEDNFVDFKSPVRLVISLAEGWKVEDGKSWIGASEKIVAEGGTVLIDEKDLFESYTSGVPAEDAKLISLIATITPGPQTAPASYTISFRVWDKKGEGYVEGSYKLNSK